MNEAELTTGDHKVHFLPKALLRKKQAFLIRRYAASLASERSNKEQITHHAYFNTPCTQQH